MKVLKLTVIIGGVILTFFVGFFVSQWIDVRPEEDSRDTTSWYTVRMVGGEEYYGHLDLVTSDSLKLDDVYYIETLSAPMAPISTSTNYQLQSELTPKEIYNLVRKGENSTSSEAHTLYLNKNAVVSWEKLTSDAQMVRLIEKSKGGAQEAK
ncbi:MAG: hypothetical protein WCV80_00690 [Candidatus Paceibacterota bacterium]|jgi:hypothetical protein